MGLDFSPPNGICRIGKCEGGWFTVGNRSGLEAVGKTKDLCARCDIFCNAVIPEAAEAVEVLDQESIISDANDIKLGGVLLLRGSNERV